MSTNFLSSIFLHYLGLTVFVLIIIVVSDLLFTFLRRYARFNKSEKLSAYECGFEPFFDARTPFDIHFYLVAVLFIIFDLELAFIFPWVSSIFYINTFGYLVMVYFLIILTLGLLYEYMSGALTWSLTEVKH